MNNDFVCPSCQGYMSVGNKIIFTISKKGWVGGILLLSPVLGDYTYEIHPSYQVKPGEEFDFICPICNENLSLHETGNLAKIIMIDSDNQKHNIIFSRKKGEQCTYKIFDEKIEKYGADANRYVDFLSASMMK